MKPKLKILIVLPFIPYEKGSGGNQAVINVLEYLRTRCNLTLVFPLRHHNQDQAAALGARWPEVDLRPYRYWEDKNRIPPFKTDRCYLDNRKKIIKARGRMLGSFFRHGVVSLNPADVIRDNSMLLVSDAVQDSPFQFFHFVRDVALEGFDIVQTEFTNFLNLPYFLPDDVCKVLVHHELRFVRLENELALYPDRRLEDDAILKYNKDMEIASLRRFDNVIVLTEQDRRLLQPLLPDTNVYCSPAAIPPGKILDFRSCGTDFVFVGAMQHHPNLDGMLWFAHDVVPILRKRIPEFKVHVVGTWDKKFTKLIHRACPEIIFEGFVSDLSVFLNGKISIVPIRIGSGMRMKILDAINSRSPFVTTSKGVEGQDFTNGKECLVADGAEAFADALARLSADGGLQKEIAVAAGVKLKELYDSDDILRRRLEVYERICSGLRT